MPFAVWKAPGQLAERLTELIAGWMPCQGLAITMTAELADCYSTKADGVAAILAAVNHAAAGVPVAVWHTSGEFVSAAVAQEFPLLTAAANWHSLATFAGRMASDQTALLIDIGSTTTDLIPLENGLPVPAGRTDGDRLLSGELVYTGIRRTPLCAVAREVPLPAGHSTLAAELFATTLDIHLLTGDLPEHPDDLDTADGRPATVAASHDRMARMVCRDRTEFPLADARNLAVTLADMQLRQLMHAVDQVLSTLAGRVETVILSGSGSFLAERLADRHPQLSRVPPDRRHSLRQLLSPDASTAACAFALARLAAERQPDVHPEQWDHLW